jgi:hypothetical protein
MAERLSTGFADAVNTVGPVKTVMNDSVIHIYSGLQPATADAVETGDLLMIVTLDSLAFVPGAPGNGLSMDVSTAGVLAKTVAETWSGDGLAAAGTGTVAGWFRWYDNAVLTGAGAAVAQVDDVTVVNAVDANVYAIDVDGTVYSHTAATSSTLITIADALAALIPNGVSDGISKVTITSATPGVAQSVTIDGTTTVGTDLTVTAITANRVAAVRIDGAIGTTTSFEMQLSNTTIVEAGPALFPTFNYTTTKQ